MKKSAIKKKSKLKALKKTSKEPPRLKFLEEEKIPPKVKERILTPLPSQREFKFSLENFSSSEESVTPVLEPIVISRQQSIPIEPVANIPRTAIPEERRINYGVSNERPYTAANIEEEMRTYESAMEPPMLNPRNEVRSPQFLDPWGGTHITSRMSDPEKISGEFSEQRRSLPDEKEIRQYKRPKFKKTY